MGEKETKQKIIEILSRLEGGMVHIYDKDSVADRILALFEEELMKERDKMGQFWFKKCEEEKEKWVKEILETLPKEKEMKGLPDVILDSLEHLNLALKEINNEGFNSALQEVIQRIKNKWK